MSSILNNFFYNQDQPIISIGKSRVKHLLKREKVLDLIAELTVFGIILVNRVSNVGSNLSTMQLVVTILVQPTTTTTTPIATIETSSIHPKHTIIPEPTNLTYKQEKTMSMIISFMKYELLPILFGIYP
jgi:UDP-3-O-acyl-N-acetylglucosamine deacetylase